MRSAAHVAGYCLQPVMKQLNEAIRKVMATPDVVERLRTLGSAPGARSRANPT